MTCPVIKAKGVSKCYGETVALKTTDLEINAGFTVIAGKSGSGKSSLLAVLSGIEKPNTGAVSHFEGDTEVFASDFRPKKRFGFRQTKNENGLGRRIAFVPQRPALNPSQTIQDNIRFLLDTKGIHPEASVRAAVIEGLGLNEYAKKFPREVSGGQNQRAALAVALLVMPKLIFLDEVTSGLDTDNARSTYDLLKNYAVEQGTTVVLASHDASAKSYADQVITLGDGQITQNLTVASDSQPLFVPAEITFPYQPAMP